MTKVVIGVTLFYTVLMLGILNHNIPIWEAKYNGHWFAQK